jgi:hypothetical protein
MLLRRLATPLLTPLVEMDSAALLLLLPSG